MGQVAHGCERIFADPLRGRNPLARKRARAKEDAYPTSSSRIVSASAAGGEDRPSPPRMPADDRQERSHEGGPE